ncbi:MAG: DUF4190 domain-containing protein [Acetatifactor sp.]|nr:DUF4190 domain-containing protein [Acetatifactor sp.]
MDERNYYQDNTGSINNSAPQDNAGLINNSVPQNNYYQDYTANMPYQVATQEGPNEYTNGLHIASLVLGIASILVCCCLGMGVIFAIPGLVCAIIGNSRSKSGIGIAGLICSIIGIVFNAFILLIFIMDLIMSINSDTYIWAMMAYYGY